MRPLKTERFFSAGHKRGSQRDLKCEMEEDLRQETEIVSSYQELSPHNSQQENGNFFSEEDENASLADTSISA